LNDKGDDDEHAAPEVDDDEHANSDFQYAASTPHAPICQHASACNEDGRCAMLTDWWTWENQTPTRNDMANLVKHVHVANNTPSAKDEFELARGVQMSFSDNTPLHIFSSGTTELDADFMR
jgi:hypothetical protein